MYVVDVDEKVAGTSGAKDTLSRDCAKILETGRLLKKLFVIVSLEVEGARVEEDRCRRDDRLL